MEQKQRKSATSTSMDIVETDGTSATEQTFQVSSIPSPQQDTRYMYILETESCDETKLAMDTMEQVVRILKMNWPPPLV